MKQKIEAKNSLSNYISSISSTIQENSNSIDKDDQKLLQDAIKEQSEFVKSATRSNNDIEKEEFENRLKELQATCDPIISKIYKKGGSASNDEEPDL